MPSPSLCSFSHKLWGSNLLDHLTLSVPLGLEGTSKCYLVQQPCNEQEYQPIHQVLRAHSARCSDGWCSLKLWMAVYTVVSRNDFPSNPPVRKCSILNGDVHEELGLGSIITSEGPNCFQAFLIFPSNLGHNAAEVWKSAEFCKRLNHTNFSVQPFHLWRKAMSKTQHHYNVCISKINLFTCKTDTLTSNQPIEIISYNVGTWFA